MLAEAGRTDLASLDMPHLALGDPEAAGEFGGGFGADEFLPGRFANLSSGRCLDDPTTLPISR